MVVVIVDTSGGVDRLLPCAEAADFLGVTVGTLANWRTHKARMRELAFVKIGDAVVRYRESDLIEFIDRHSYAQKGSR